MKYLLVGLMLLGSLLVVPRILAQGFNVASTYEVTDPEAKSGDIIISKGAAGLGLTNLTYDSHLFGVLQDDPMLVIREASGSGRPIIQAGQTDINVTDANGDIKKGDLITSSEVKGRGMRAGQSGYVIGIALTDVVYTGSNSTAGGKTYRNGTVPSSVRIEYAEINTARNNIQLLNQLNAALFSTVKDPEKAVLLIRYLIGGIIAIIAFAIGFFFMSRSIGKAVEAIGRNPLAKRSILLSVAMQLVLTLIAALATIVIVFIIIRI